MINSKLSADACAETLGNNVSPSILAYARTGKAADLTTKGFTQSLQGMTISAKAGSIAMKALSVAGSMLTVAGVTIGISLIVKGLDALIVTTKEQIEKLKDVNASYEETTNKLKDVNKELNTTKDRMNELNSKDSLTFVEKEELDKLKEATKELLIQQDILEKQKEEEAKTLGKEAIKTYNKQYGKYDVSEDQIDEYVNNANRTGNNAILKSDEKDISAMIAAYKQFTELQEEAIANNDSDEAKRYQDMIGDISTSLNHSLKDLSDFKKILESIPFDSLDKDGQKAFKDIGTAIEIIYKNIDPNKWKDIQFNSVFDNAKEVKEELLELDKAGKLDKSVLTSNQKYNDLLTQTGLTVSEVVVQIHALNDETAESDPITQKLNDNLDELESSLNTLATTADKTTGYISAIGEKVDVSKIQTAINDSMSSVKELQSLLESIDNNNGLSVDVLNTITSNYPQLLKYVGDEKALREQIKKTIESQKKSAENYYKSIMTLDSSYYKQALTNNSDWVNKLNKDYGIDLNNFGSLAEAKYAINASLYKKLGGLQKSYNALQSSSFSSNDAFYDPLAKFNTPFFEHIKQRLMDNTQKEIDKVHSGINESNKLIDNLINEASKGFNTSKYNFSGSSSKSGSSKATNSSSKAMNSFSESIDWTIVTIQNLEKELEKLNSQLENTYGWDAQLKIQKNIIAKQKELSKAYSKETSYYKKYYNRQKKGLSSNYVRAIEKGTKFSIEDFKGVSREKTYNKIQKVQEAWNRLQDAKQNALNAKYEIAHAQDRKIQVKIDQYSAIVDKLESQVENYSGWKKQNQIVRQLTKNQKKLYGFEIKQAKTVEEKVKLQQELNKLISENAKLQFDNIQAYYDNRVAFNESKQQRLQSQIDLTATKGYEVGAEFYNKLITLNKNEVGRLKEEQKKLQTALNRLVKDGEIGKYSPKWYEMMGDIYSVGDAIDNANKNVIEFQNSLQQLSWDRFDGLIDKFSQLTSESDFLINLLSNKKLIGDNGGYTNEGLATQGQYGANYNTYMAKAKEIDKELVKLDKHSLDQNVQNRIKELTQARYDAILAAESEKQAMIDLAKQGVQAEIDSFAELIDKKKEALDAEQDLYEYQKSISKSKKSITLLQKQINAISGDDSDETKKKLRELKASLADAQSDLDDKVYDRNVKDRKEYLDDELKSYTESMEDYMDDTDKMFEDILDSVNINTTTIANTLEKTANKVGYALTENMTNVWIDGKLAISNYTKTFTQKSSTILTVLDDIRNGWAKINEEFDKYAKISANAVEKDYTNAAGAEKQTYKNILGSKSSKPKVSGNSQLNQYVTGLGYKELNFKQMYDLGKALGTKGVNSLKDVDNTKASNGANRNAIMKDLQHQLVKDFLGTQKYPANKNSNAYKNTTRVNRYLMDKKYQKLSAGGQVELAKLLGLSGITTSNYTTSSNLDKILNALKNNGFSKGGIASKVNRVIKGNGDEGITTIRREELVLDPKKSKSFYQLTDYAPDFIKVMKDTLAYDTNKAFSGFNNLKSNSNISERNNSTTIGDINLVIDAPNVTDSESFIAELKTPRVKDLIRHTVLDVAMGKGSLNVNKY